MSAFSAAMAVMVTTCAWADAIDVSLTNRVPRGQLPSIRIHILEPIAGFKVNLTRGDGVTLEKKGGGKPGVIRTIELEHAEGVMHWSGSLSINLPDGQTGSMALDFDTEIQGPLKLSVDKQKDVDFDRRRIAFTLNRPIAKVHLKVLLESGTVAFDRDVDFNAEPAGSRLEVTWPETSGRVMIVDLRAFDTSTFYDSVELTKWQVDIPHEEVNFDSGKWDIRSSEQAKIDESYRQINDAVVKFGKLAPIRLFVAGHTDTMGPKDSNRSLSLNRARAIGLALRKKGLRIPVLYEGFGEEALLVATPDEADEAKNRRAEYIIAIDDPTTHNVPFAPKWRSL